MSHRLSRRLNNATGQCPVVCPSHVDNDGTVARGVWTYTYPSRRLSRRPVVPLLFKPTDTVARLITGQLADCQVLAKSWSSQLAGWTSRRLVRSRTSQLADDAG